jgi:hypothetical protein
VYKGTAENEATIVQSLDAEKSKARRERSYVVDVDFVVVPELECALALLLAHRICLVDLGIFRELSVCFHWKNDINKVNEINGKGERIGRTATGFVGGVLDDDVCLVILELAEGDEDDISLVNPNL